MARPRKSTTEEIQNYFADMSVDDQASMLAGLNLIHRLAKRNKSPKQPDTGAAQTLDLRDEEEPDVPVL